MGDVHLKFWVKLTALERNRRFSISFRPYALAVTSSEKSSIITNRKSTTRFPMSPRWTSYIVPKPPKGGSKTQNVQCVQNLNNELHAITPQRYDIGCQSLLGSRIRTFDWYRPRWPWMTLNGVMAVILRFSPNSIALLAKYATLVEYRPIIFVNIFSQFQSSTVGHN